MPRHVLGGNGDSEQVGSRGAESREVSQGESPSAQHSIAGDSSSGSSHLLGAVAAGFTEPHGSGRGKEQPMGAGQMFNLSISGAAAAALEEEAQMSEEQEEEGDQDDSVDDEIMLI